MPTLVAKLTSRHQRVRRRRVSRIAADSHVATSENSLAHAVGAAAARDLARRATTAAQGDDAALVNAVARAAARSLAS